MTLKLMPWAQEAQDQFRRDYGYGGNCSCHISPPCACCTHEGNPHNLAEDPYAWAEVHIVMAEEAQYILEAFVDALVAKHLKEMKGTP
jgi:hypothetical protein